MEAGCILLSLDSSKESLTELWVLFLKKEIRAVATTGIRQASKNVRMLNTSKKYVEFLSSGINRNAEMLKNSHSGMLFSGFLTHTCSLTHAHTTHTQTCAWP